MNYSIELDKYELNTLKSLVRAEYQKMQTCFNNQSQDDFGKDIIKDSMIRLLTISSKLDNVITRVSKRQKPTTKTLSCPKNARKWQRRF